MFGFWKKEKTATQEKPAAKEKASKKPEAVTAEHAHGELKVKVAERKACHLTLSIQVPADRVEAQVEESFRRIQGKARIPGFRPGKAPLDLVRKNFEATAREDALDQMLRRAVHEALHEQDITPVTTPAVADVQYDVGKPLAFELEVECAPSVELKNYKGLPVEKKDLTVPAEEVEKRLEELRETHAKLAPSAAEQAGERHFVVVDYVGLLDGLPIDGGKAEGQLIDMSAPQALAGFTDGLRGAKAGEVRKIPVMFPAEHPKKELAGKQVIFQVTVSEIKEKQVPVLDDEFAKDVGCKDAADLRERVRKTLEAERARVDRQRLEKELSDGLLEIHDFEVPASLVTERAQFLNRNLKQYLLRQGASEEDWKTNEEKMTAKNKTEAERSIRLSYILSKIAEEEKIEVTDQEVDETVRKSVESVNAARRREMERWMADRRNEVRAQLKEEKIFTLLIGSAMAQEPKIATA